MANKIKYGLKSVYYAVGSPQTGGGMTYSTPVAFPGAVSISLEPQGENTPFYADNITYWVGNGNNGYSGDLEMAMIIDSFKTDILGYVKDTKDVVFEDQNSSLVHFALLFQFEGDDKATRHVFYNCTATRPNAAGETVGENVEPQTETVTITATSIYDSGLAKNIVKAEAGPGSDSTTYNGWFSAVYKPTVGS